MWAEGPGPPALPGPDGIISRPEGTPPGAPPPAVIPPSDRTVVLTFEADRNQLFTAWNAIANLADLAGTVNVTIRAESADGFDKSKLQNGVLEPLREADLIP